MKEITLYTDGACSGNPGRGGWGAILEFCGIEKELCGGKEETTNNRMELTAVIEGLKALKEPCLVTIFSDSAYVVNAFQKGWIEDWQKNGFKTSQKKDVQNQDLWKELQKLCEIHKVSWEKVKGHSVVEKNNRCDALARKYQESKQKEEK